MTTPNHTTDEGLEPQEDSMDADTVAPPGSDTPDPEVDETDAEMIELSPEAAEVVERLQAERDDAISARQRAFADYANYQRRSLENERRARRDGTASVVRALLPLVDDFELALAQEADQLTVEQLLDGVGLVRKKLLKAIEDQGVERIEPAVGDEFNPMRHEAMMRQPAEGIEPHHIVAVLQPGYAIDEAILRPAKVTVAPADDD